MKKCLPCFDGCLSCNSLYDCNQCRPDFIFLPEIKLCIEVCGDGKRYASGCDDGNNFDGDGCSRDCKVEVGYSCYGGSPNSRDICSSVFPSQIFFENRGQSRLFGKVILSIKVNYLPKVLLDSVNGCNDYCKNVLAVNTQGVRSAVSINVRYIPTTSFLFSIEVDFGQQSIDLFSLEIGINQGLRQFFTGVDISKKLTIDVRPVYLATVEKLDRLS